MTQMENCDFHKVKYRWEESPDPREYCPVCKREAFSDDGSAYIRTADVAIEILKGKR